MLRSDVVEAIISGKIVSDEGLVCEIRTSPQLKPIIEDMRHAHYLLKRRVKALKALGVTAEEVPFGTELDGVVAFTFSGTNQDVVKACRLAFAMGGYCQQRDSLFMQYCTGGLRVHQREKAGKAGGAAVSAPAKRRHDEIKTAYCAWAGAEDNGKSIAAFASALEKKKSRSKDTRGFSRKSIERVIQCFHDEVLECWDSLRVSLPPCSTTRRDKMVADHLKGQPGISLETVRRALA